MTGPLVAKPGPCPTCGRPTDRSEEWSTGQCDSCYVAAAALVRTRDGNPPEHLLRSTP